MDSRPGSSPPRHSRPWVSGEAIRRVTPLSRRACTIAPSPSWAWVNTSVRAGLPVDSATIARYSGTGMPRGTSISRVSAPSATHPQLAE